MAAIRKAAAQDIDGIYAVFLDMLASEDTASKKTASWLMDVRRRPKDFELRAKKELLREIKERNSLYLIAEIDEHIAGYAYGSVNKYKSTFFSIPPLASLNGIVVKKKFRGKGIAKDLNKAMEHWFKKRGCKQIYLDVFCANPAVKMYHRWGYKTVHHRMAKQLRSSP